MSYKLKPLNELKDFISINGHLPNIPNAAEVDQENGISLGEMNTKLLEKVEELTLYIIKQEESAEGLRAANEEIKNTLETQDAQLKLLIEKVNELSK